MDKTAHKPKKPYSQGRGEVVAWLLDAGALLLIMLAIVAMLIGGMVGCSSSSVREERNEQVPGEAWYLEIDTRKPVPTASLRGSTPQIAPGTPQFVSRQGTLDTCHPIARALALASIGSMEPPKPQPIQITAPDGSKVTLPSDIQGVLRLGSAKGQDASAHAPADGGGSAYAKATTIIGSKIKAPAKGVALILVGGLLVAAGVFCGFTKWLTVRSAVGLSLAGGACLACGWLIDSPLAGWLIALAIVGGLMVLALYILDSKGKVDGELALKAVAKAVNKSPDAARIKANVDDFAGAAKQRVKSTIGKVKAKEKIGSTT